jgi:hypothetical protein
MAEKPKRRRIFGPLTYCVLVAAAIVLLGHYLYPLIEKHYQCGRLLRDLHSATTNRKFWIEREFTKRIDPSTSYWVDLGLKDDDPLIRRLAFSVIPRAYPPTSKAYAMMIKAFSDPDPSIRRDIAYQIINLYHKNKHFFDQIKCRETIIEAAPLLKDSLTSVRGAAIKLIEAFPRDLAGIDDIKATMLNDPFPNHRLDAIAYVSSCADPTPAIKKLVESKLNDPDESVRLFTAETLAKHVDDRDQKIAYLKSVVRYPQDVRIKRNSQSFFSLNYEYVSIIRSIERLTGERETIDFLFGMVRDSDPRVRAKGIAILQLCKDSYSRMRNIPNISRAPPIDYASDILRVNRIADLVRTLDDPDAHVRLAAVILFLSEPFSMFQRDTSSLDRVLRGIIADRQISMKDRSDACYFLLARVSKWDDELGNFFLSNLDRNDEELFQTLLMKLDRLGPQAKPAIPVMLKLIDRFPFDRKSFHIVLNHIDSVAADKWDRENTQDDPR